MNRVANRDIYNAMARVGEMCCILTLAGTVILVFAILLWNRYA